MAKASYMQTSFLGGEWSPFAQGRADSRDYRTGMNVCRNGIPVEEGAWTRRPGTRWLEDTRKGRPGKLLAFHFTQAAPFNIELTDGYLRFFAGNSLVMETEEFVVVAASTATPAELTLDDDHGWATGDAVKVSIQAGDIQVGVANLMNRTFQIVASDTNKVELYDPITGLPFDGTGLDLGDIVLGIDRVLEFTTPYTALLFPDVNIVQDETHALLLHSSIKPRIITDITEPGRPRAFTFSTAEFLDGPYLDPPADDDGSFLTPSGTVGTLTLTESGGFYDFVATDVGRLIRLFSSPPTWSSATTYAVGDSVTYGNSYYTALTAGTNKKPDISLDDWALDPTAAIWTWAVIATVVDTSHITATIQGDPLLSATPITSFRLGVYSDTTGWPTCGTLHESRLWLGGVVPNRFDASMSNEFLRFDPTGDDGTVADNNGISEVIRAPSGVNTILWMMTDDQGVLMGSQAGEWLIRSSASNDPLTPTSIQAHQMTNYGSSNLPPIRAGMSIGFVHRFGRKLLEYTAYGEARFGGNNLSITGKHLSASGIAEIAYQQELVPVIWARTNDGQLIGCTYKRDNPVGTQPASFSGWHRHDLGSDRTITSLQAGPSLDGTLDSVMLITKDPDEELYQVELLTTVFDEDTPIYEAWFTDSGVRPSFAEVLGSEPNQTIRLYGLSHLEGKLISVFAAGVDMGDFTVADGEVDIPFNGTDNLLTDEWLRAITETNSAFENIGVYILNTDTGIPAVIDGLTILRYTRDAGQVNKTTFGAPMLNWGNNQLLSLSFGSPGDVPTSGFRKFNLETGAMIDDCSTDSLDYPIEAGVNLTDTMCIDPDGFLYWNASAGNYGGIVKLDPNERRVNGTLYPAYSFYGHVGQANSGSGVGPPPQPNGALPGSEGGLLGIPNTGCSMAAQTSSGRTYVFSAASFHSEWDFGTGDGVHVINATDMIWLTKGTPGAGDYTFGQFAHAPSFSKDGFDWASVYMMGTRIGGLIADPLTQVTLYRLGATGVAEASGTLSVQEIGTLLASDVDATFTSFQDFQFGLRDEMDGNLIGSCRGDTGVYYIVKVNSKTCALMWAIQTDNKPSGQSLRLGRCAQGQYAFYSNQGVGPYNYYVIDTINGVLTDTIVVAGVPRFSSDQAFDDVSGRVVLKGSYDAFAGPGTPTAVPPTPDTGFGEDWLSLPGIDSTIPYPPGVTNYYAPISVGYSFTSQGQILRPVAQEETGAVNGPALGKTRRQHMFTALLHKTQGISFGTVFGKLFPAKLSEPNGVALPATTLYSATIQDTLQDDYSFDSMLAWEVTRPYPATVLTIGGFIQTQDR